MKPIVFVCFALLCVVAIGSGILGVNFGYHWDEWFALHSVGQAIEHKTFLPAGYLHPSVGYELCFLSIVPDIFFSSLEIKDEATRTRTLIDLSRKSDFKCRARRLFIWLTYLSLIWIFCLVLSWRKNQFEALLAVSLIGLSWEVSYHARWIAPDAILMQFGVLTMLCVFSRSRWSAVFAGLACGTKYTGAILMVPVLLGEYYRFKEYPEKGSLLSSFVKSTLLFLLAFLLVTPGAIFEPHKFITDIAGEAKIYALTKHYGYTVTRGLIHLLRMMEYFAAAVFSRFATIAIFFFTAAIVGGVWLIKNERRNALIFLSVPALYLVFFSFQVVMIVRNLLLLVPFFAVLAARGCVVIYSKLNARAGRALFVGLIVGALGVNATWLLYAADSIRTKNAGRDIGQLAGYLDKHPKKLFLVSKEVQKNLFAFDQKNRVNITSVPSDSVDAAVLYSTQTYDENYEWQANHRDYVLAQFGPQAVNFNYYPTWLGNRLIVVIPAKYALKSLKTEF